MPINVDMCGGEGVADVVRISRALVAAHAGEIDLQGIAIGQVLTDAVEGLDEADAVNLFGSVAVAAAKEMRAMALIVAVERARQTGDDPDPDQVLEEIYRIIDEADAR